MFRAANVKKIDGMAAVMKVRQRILRVQEKKTGRFIYCFSIRIILHLSNKEKFRE
jgi:hypothetical protein